MEPTVTLLFARQRSKVLASGAAAWRSGHLRTGQLISVPISGQPLERSFGRYGNGALDCLQGPRRLFRWREIVPRTTIRRNQLGVLRPR